MSPSGQEGDARSAGNPSARRDVHGLCDGVFLTAEDEAGWFRRMAKLKEEGRRRLALLPAGDSQAQAGDSQAGDSQAAEARRLLDEAEQIRNGLASVFMRLAIGLSRRFVTNQCTLDELVSEASLTLLQAIENFNVELGFRFSTYATRAIRRNLYRYVIKRRSQSRRETLCDDLLDAPDHRATELVISEGPSPSELNTIVGQLRERDAYIVRRRFGLFYESPPFTLQRVADELGVTRERVRQLENRALRQLRTLASERFAASLEA